MTDAHSKLMGDDTVIQVMGGRCLKVLSNMREIKADQHGYLGGTDLATTLTSRGFNWVKKLQYTNTSSNRTRSTKDRSSRSVKWGQAS